MNRSGRRRVELIASIVVTALCTMCAATRAADDAAGEVEPAQIARWIEQLGDDDYSQREQAMQRLTAAGGAALDAVAAAAVSDSPETAWRAGELLERIGVSSDEQTVERVCRAMEQLSAKSPRFGRVAGDLRMHWREFRHGRAAERLRKLGGEVTEVAAQGGYGGSPFGYLGPIYSGSSMPLVVTELAPAESIDVDVDRLVEIKDPETRTLKVEVPEPAGLAPVEATPAEAPAEAAEEKPALEPSDLSKRIDALIEEKLKVTPILEPISEDIPGAAEKAASSPAASADLATETSIRAALAEADAAGFTEVYSSDLSLTFGGGMYVLPDGYVNGSEQAQRQVRLGPQWKGSDADLAVLRDLNHAAVLEISDRKLTDAALEHIAAMPELAQLTLQNVAYDRVALRRFKKLRPEVNVHAFGPAILGISGEPAEDGFLVNHVVPESGAAKGGIESGDVIRRIDGETVDSFEALTLVIAPHKPGDTVSLEFTRGGEAKTGRAALGAR